MRRRSANINQTVTFDGSLTRDEGVLCGDNCTYLWDFGSDSATRTGRVVSLSFPTAGSRTVRLYVTDNRGFMASKSQIVHDQRADPAGGAVPRHPAAAEGGQRGNVRRVVLDRRRGRDHRGVCLGLRRRRGATGIGKTATYAYTLAGSKSVTLTVTDDLGRTNQQTSIVTAIP